MIEDEPLVLIPYYKLTFGHFMDADRPELTNGVNESYKITASSLSPALSAVAF